MSGSCCPRSALATAAKVSSIDAQGPDAIVLRLRDGSRVMWGSAEESELKSEWSPSC